MIDALLGLLMLLTDSEVGIAVLTGIGLILLGALLVVTSKIHRD